MTFKLTDQKVYTYQITHESKTHYFKTRKEGKQWYLETFAKTITNRYFALPDGTLNSCLVFVINHLNTHHIKDATFVKRMNELGDIAIKTSSLTHIFTGKRLLDWSRAMIMLEAIGYECLFVKVDRGGFDNENKK